MSEQRPALDTNTILAAERTLLAWLRTAISMMGFGFVVARFGLFMKEMAAVQQLPAPTGLSIWIGGTLIVLGVVTAVLAAANHVHQLRRLVRGERYQPAGLSLGLLVTLVLAALGVVMTIYLAVSAA